MKGSLLAKAARAIRLAPYLLAVPMASTAFFGASLLGSWVNPRFTFGYSSPIARPGPILGRPLDEQALSWSLAPVLFAVYLAWAFRPGSRLGAVLITHLVLPASYAIFYYKAPSYGVAFLAYAGILASATTLAYFDRLFGLKRARAASLTALLLAILYLYVGLSALQVFAADPQRVQLWLQSPLPGYSPERMAEVELGLYYLASPLLPWALLAILTSPAWYSAITMAMALRWLFAKRGRAGLGVLGLEGSGRGGQGPSAGGAGGVKARLLRWVPRSALALAMASGFYLTYFPYFYRGGVFGVDAPYYRERLLAGPSSIAALALSGDYTALYLMLLHLVQLIGNVDADMALRLGPGAIAALFALSSYLLAYSLTGDEWTGALASALSVSSVQTTVGMYAGIYGGWIVLALTFIVYALVGLMARGGGRGGLALLAVAVPASLLGLFHPWTWGLFVAASAIGAASSGLLAVPLKASRRPLLRLALGLGVVVAANLAVAASIYLGYLSALGGVKGAISSAEDVYRSLSVGHIWRAPGILDNTIKTYVGSFYFNPPIYAMALLGLVYSLKLDAPSRAVAVPFIAASSGVALLLESWYQWRALYVIPYHLLAAMGLAWLARFVTGSGPSRRGRPWLVSRLAASALCAAFALASFNYALRALFFVAMLFGG